MQRDKNNKHLIVIAGPTASGKTDFAIRLAEHFDTEIISADSRQCYREMSIGTAKPTHEEQKRAKHHFINTHSIFDEISAADYEKYALEVLENIFKEKDYAIVCGGTGLYINALCNGMDEMPQVDKNIEQQLNDNYRYYGLQWLQEETKKHDPEFYRTAEQQNPVRLLRGLAFILSNKVSITKFRSGNKKSRPFNIIKIALNFPREILYERINQRVDIMMKEGLLEEVKTLYPYRYLKSLQTVGYSEFYDYNTFPPDEKELVLIIDKIKQHTRNYAKRQITWFKKDPGFNWLPPDDIQAAIELVKNYQ